MISSESRRDWMHRFGSRSMKLEPDLNAVNAAQHAAAYAQQATVAEPARAAATSETDWEGGDFAGDAAPSSRSAKR